MSFRTGASSLFVNFFYLSFIINYNDMFFCMYPIILPNLEMNFLVFLCCSKEKIPWLETPVAGLSCLWYWIFSWCSGWGYGEKRCAKKVEIIEFWSEIAVHFLGFDWNLQMLNLIFNAANTTLRMECGKCLNLLKELHGHIIFVPAVNVLSPLKRKMSLLRR